jgi:type II secretory ATPase GspE/PulE/Tfp pilus assembly ATPase PilB-like protein
MNAINDLAHNASDLSTLPMGLTANVALVEAEPIQAVPAVAAPRDPEELWNILQHKNLLAKKTHHLGQALIDAHAIDNAQLQQALHAQANDRAQGLRSMLGRSLVASGVITEQLLEQVIADWLGSAVIDATGYQFDAQALALIRPDVAERELALPLMLHEDLLVVLMADIHDHRLLEELRFMTQHRIVGVLAAPGTLMPAIARAYAQPAKPAASAMPAAESSRASSKDLARDMSQDEAKGLEAESDVVSESDNTLVRMINSLIEEAIALKASDIHIETQPAPRKVRIRLRVDGELLTHLEVEARFRFALVARIKIMANMDISEHRKPQDGKIDFARFGGTRTELRVVTVPTSNGLEDVVLRLLAGSKALPLSHIGLNPHDLVALQLVARKPYGLILVCGPTGSGKTTTLHSLISDINSESRKIWTAEDPIEITQEGLRQVQMNPRIGWTFAAAMRTFLRADPDVIMIGEVRDEETARIAIEASLTGHLVMSTLHTNSAAESIARLLEIGLDPFNFSDSLLAILAQRLVRRYCTHCVVSGPVDPDEIRNLAVQYLEGVRPYDEADLRALVARWRQEFGQDDSSGHKTLRSFSKGGCKLCEGHGFKGRLGIYELLLNNDAIRGHIRRRDAASDIRLTALQSGMKTLRQDGIEKVLQGLTALSEVVAASNL